MTEKKFPEESDDGVIRIADNKIICEGKHNIQSCEVSIEDIQYAYVVVNSNKQSFLFLFDHHQNFIPTLFKGFADLYKTLSAKFGFNDELFFENVSSQEIIRKEIWRRTQEPTYKLLDSDHKDYGRGYEIQSPEKQFISWDLSFDELEKNPNVFPGKTAYGQKIVKFKYPVRIGNILLKNFHSYSDNGRTDAPVQHFYTECYDAQGTDKSFNDLKARLQKDLGPDLSRRGYERSDQKNIYFSADGMSLSIGYTYDSDWQYNGGYTSFSIGNQREYPTLLINEPYEKDLVVTSALIFKEKVSTSGDYKRSAKVKRRPVKITDQFGEATLIWIDAVNDKIGFSSGQFCQVYSGAEIIAFSIQNLLPAKGPGGAYLELTLKDSPYRMAIFKGACYCFNVYADQIKTLTGKVLTFGQEDYDC